MEVVVIIPARYGSTRLPGKPLMPLAGKPIIQHVYERCQKAGRITQVVVATDDKRIVKTVESFGGQSIMTSSECRTGTDRVAEAARFTRSDVIVNVQGDEPLIHPSAIDRVVALMEDDREAEVGTLMRRATDLDEVLSSHAVKVVCDRHGRALYFSRSPIPFVRDRQLNEQTVTDCPFYIHLGIYAYRYRFLTSYTTLSSTLLEECEQLEQLRVLEHGYRIAIAETTYRSIGIDTLHDLVRAEEMLENT
ncbi:MAG: 3-deoxy-manno-octulosonate cytidylyltransferase [Candidatus Latescibacteria bacterium]|nr:3-deoxy-manno-octulosonate cytidylyltransferase [Candidatus Latescibacterota bacterium]